ncbi:hypothetical protein Trydic_g8041 [Trypoxylus dichotomus]
MNWCPFDFIGKTFGEEREVQQFVDPPDFEPGLIVDGGICYMRFLKKLFIPCYARSENVMKGSCSVRDINDAAQRCKTKKRRRARKRKPCVRLTSTPQEPPCVCKKKTATKQEAEKPVEKPPEVKPVEEKPPESQTCKLPVECEATTSHGIMCPNCNKLTTIIICDSCNKCHKLECKSQC